MGRPERSFRKPPAHLEDYELDFEKASPGDVKPDPCKTPAAKERARKKTKTEPLGGSGIQVARDLFQVKTEPVSFPASGPARAAAAAARVKAEPLSGPPRHPPVPQSPRSLLARVAREVPQFVWLVTELDSVQVQISPSSADTVPRGLRDARLASRDVASMAVAFVVPAREIAPLWDSLAYQVCPYLPAQRSVATTINAVRRAATEPPAEWGSKITQTAAIEIYGIPWAALVRGLAFELRQNPHGAHCPPMKLFDRAAVRDLAHRRHGCFRQMEAAKAEGERKAARIVEDLLRRDHR